MFLNSSPSPCQPGEVRPTEADWNAFAASAFFAPGTDMQAEKNNFLLTTCKNDLRSDPYPFNPQPTPAGNISPALILAAAAAYFFAG
jgi:hypothetical protein